MSQFARLPAGGAVDRSRALAFSFDGLRYTGYAGDTLASALLANGVRLVGRSFKYHRPRGVYTAGPEEPNALVQVGAGARTLPNLPATMVELHDGLEAASINRWPSLDFDLRAVNDLLSPLLPAGFYYKTFIGRGRAWRFHERWIRRAAGLGRAPPGPDPDRYEKRYAFCDVLVVGAGPAGLAAACAAAASGARVIVCDERARAGGQLLWRDETVDGVPAGDWVAARERELARHPECWLLARTTAFAYLDHDLVLLAERVTGHLAAPPAQAPRERLWKVRAREVVLATGAIERGLAFHANDRPGVMLASAAHAYASQFAVRPGACAVVFTNNDSGHASAAALAAAGVEIAAVVDPRAEAADRGAHGLPVQAGAAVVEVLGTSEVAGVRVAALDRSGAIRGVTTREIDCDLVLVAGGWDPAVHLWSQSGGRLEFDPLQQCFLPGRRAPAQRVNVVGAAAGLFDTASGVAQGRALGAWAASAAGSPRAATRAGPPPIDGHARAPRLEVPPFWESPSLVPGKSKKFVDLQSDVTAADLALAAREGYRSVEHAKRYTTSGMGVDQGKTGNVLAFGVLGAASGRGVPEVGTTTFRPPYTPVAFGTLAGAEVGERFDPLRRTPMHEWHLAAGAQMEPVGLWQRPFCYRRPDEGERAAVEREARAAREAIAVCDVSTLGKIEVGGPDALTLLERLYTGRLSTLAVGACRYALMLREDGMLFDDGIVARVDETRWLLSTTSAGAEAVASHIEEWLQCEWTELRAYATPVTTQWAGVMVAGARARELLATLQARDGGDLDWSPAAFPHMRLRTGRFCGVPARVLRVSFTGELSFELNVPARHGAALWERLLDHGCAYGATPIGTEALHVLRAEKGYIAIGHETDGTVTPFDLGLGALVAATKGDFIGRRSLARPDLARRGRRQLVGLATVDPAVVVPEGTQIVAAADARRLDRPPVPMIGHVTSSYRSPTLGRSIALALIENGADRHGETVAVVARGRPVPAVIRSPVFFDPEGARVRA